LAADPSEVNRVRLVPVAEAHQEVSRSIDEDLARAHAKFAAAIVGDLNNFETLKSATFSYIAEGFEIHASHHVTLLADYDSIAGWYESFLEKLASDSLKDAEVRVGPWPPMVADQFMHALRGYLIGRRSHWKAEAISHTRKLEALMREQGLTNEVTPLRAPATELSDPARAVMDKDQRARMLAEYKKAAGNPSNKKIYEAKNSGVHKPEFYDWLNGKLDPDSAPAINFERFLKLKKPPIPRQSKD